MTAVKILLVDDQQDIRECLVEFLADDGFEIVQADSGDAAYPLLERTRPQLLLTDIDMPGSLDGIALAQLARTICPVLPVVFITGKPDEAVRAQTLQSPRVVLNKPFGLSHLLATLRHLIDGPAADWNRRSTTG